MAQRCADSLNKGWSSIELTRHNHLEGVCNVRDQTLRIFQFELKVSSSRNELYVMFIRYQNKKEKLGKVNVTWHYYSNYN